MSRFTVILLLACLTALIPSTGRCDSPIPIAPRPALHARKLAFSPDGKLVVALGVPVKVPANTPLKYRVEIKGARVWTVADGKSYRDYPWVGSDAKQVAFSPDSQYLALPGQGNIKIVHLATNQVRATIDTTNGQRDFYFSPDGKWFLVEGDWYKSPDPAGELFTKYSSIDIWHLNDKGADIIRTQQKVKSRMMNVKYSVEYPPGAAPVVQSKPLTAINWCQSDQRDQWERMHVSDNGEWQALVYKGPVNTIQIWDATKRTLKSAFTIPEDLPRNPIPSLHFSPSNRWLCSGLGLWSDYYHRNFYLWNVANGTTTTLKPDLGADNTIPIIGLVLYLEGHTEWEVTPKYAMSPDENLMAFSHGVSADAKSNSILTLYDLNTGQRLPTVFE